MSRVFVVDAKRRPLNPCTPARARLLLREQKAAVLRRFPFTLILNTAHPEGVVTPLRLKVDPGSKTTGMALVNDASGEAVWAAELTHRGEQVHQALTKRRGVRRERRFRHTRYRPARFHNRRRSIGWLPPSLRSRLDNVLTWVARLRRVCSISAISQELVKFDLQQMEQPEITGVQYQQGTLAGYEVREYVLSKWQRTCAYCGKHHVPLQVEHIEPRARGGTDRVSNLTLACPQCNQKKGNQDVGEFLTRDMARAEVTAGKYVGVYVGRMVVRATGFFSITTKAGTVQGQPVRYFRRLHRADGYSYRKGERCLLPVP